MDPQILLGLQNSLRDIHSVKANSIFIWVALKTLDVKLAAAADDPDDAQDQIIFAESDSSFFQWARWVRFDSDQISRRTSNNKSIRWHDKTNPAGELDEQNQLGKSNKLIHFIKPRTFLSMIPFSFTSWQENIFWPSIPVPWYRLGDLACQLYYLEESWWDKAFYENESTKRNKAA